MLPIMFNLVIDAVWEKGKPVLAFLEWVVQAMFSVTNQTMKVAPFDVFVPIDIAVSNLGVTALIPLSKLAITTYGAMIFFCNYCIRISC